MSYSTLVEVFRTKANCVAEYRNSHGTAPVVWGLLCAEYLGRGVNDWGLGNFRMQSLWDLAKDQKVPRYLRLVHVFTFDGAVFSREHAEELADACVQFGNYAEAHPKWGASRVNHWRKVGEDIRDMQWDRRALGVGLNCTSCGDVWLCDMYPQYTKPFDGYGYVGGFEKAQRTINEIHEDPRPGDEAQRGNETRRVVSRGAEGRVCFASRIGEEWLNATCHCSLVEWREWVRKEGE